MNLSVFVHLIEMNGSLLKQSLVCTLLMLGIATILPKSVGVLFIDLGAIEVVKALSGSESFSCSGGQSTQTAQTAQTALDFLQVGIRWNCADTRANYLLARTFAQQGQYNSALDTLRELSQSTMDAVVHLCTGDIYDAMGSPNQAYAEWLLSSAGNIFLKRAEVSLAIRDTDSASENLSLAIRFLDRLFYSRRLADAYLALGIQYRELGKQQRGIAALEQATAVYDNVLATDNLDEQSRFTFRILRIQTLRERQMYAQAVEDLGQIVEVEPTGWAYAELGVTYAYLMNWAEAIRALRLGLQRDLGSDPSAFPYWIQLGIAYRQNDEYDAALRVLKQVAQETSSVDWQAWAYTEMGITLAVQGDVLESLSPLQRAVMLDPNWTHSRLALASSLATLKRTSEACEQYRTIISLDNDNEVASPQMTYLRCPEPSQISP